MKKFIVSIMFVILPFMLYLNIIQKMNDYNYVGISGFVRLFQDFPILDNSFESLSDLQANLIYIEEVFTKPSTDFFQNTANFFKGIAELVIGVVQFVVAVITDIIQLIVYVFNISKPKIL